MTRLEMVIDYLGIKPSSFAHSLNVTPSTITAITKGVNQVGAKVLGRIAEVYPEINLDWLISGRGSMLRSKNEMNEPAFHYYKKTDQLYNYNEMVKKVNELDESVQELKKFLNQNDDSDDT